MATFNFVLYVLAVLTCLACTVLLFRGYARSGVRLLLWSALCFVGLSVSNVMLFADLVLFPTQVDLRLYRLLAALKRREAAGFLPDQVPGEGEGEWAEFFGELAYTATLAPPRPPGASAAYAAWWNR